MGKHKSLNEFANLNILKGQTTNEPILLLEITNPSFFNWEITPLPG